MTFTSRNAYYLRISATTILPLYLYLDERHIDWMSDMVLQHVLADLRPLVIPKLHAERDIHFGPGTKKGSVEVHRGEAYQFAYFFRKTEPHSVVIKSRYFVAAPPRSEVAPVPVAPPPPPPPPPPADKTKKRRGNRPSVNQPRRKRPKTKGKHKAPDNHLDEGILSTEESEEDNDDEIEPQGAPSELRRSRRQRRVIAGGYQENDEDDMEDVDAYQDVDMEPPPVSSNVYREPPTNNVDASDNSAPALNVKSEDVDEALLGVVEGDTDADIDGDDQPLPTHATSDIDLVVEEEEEKKPKPLLKLKYQSFTVSGHCLCVVVEPWPPQRAATRLRSVAPLGTGLLPPPSASSEASITEQRARTPLFLPEFDRAPSEAPFPRERTLPPVPLFHDDPPADDDDDGYTSDDLMDFSQVLNSAGHMMTVTADDDDDMDGAVLFGDADEVREFS
ncbi:hypothetical protein HYDPIDRAFT_35497 [Hydnomerulius pinastri MD-312]|nr:hypothetical protein HYDPIDRAFT_35497 [Hydnomerulius pinastri MD-312]